jgi:uncharacterized protein (TIGR00251 family)
MPWLRNDGDAVILSLHVQPGANKTEVVGVHGDALKIRLAAPPVDGRANQCLIKFIAAQLGIGKNSVTLISGDNARSKRVRAAGVDATDVRAQLKPAS